MANAARAEGQITPADVEISVQLDRAAAELLALLNHPPLSLTTLMQSGRFQEDTMASRLLLPASSSAESTGAPQQQQQLPREGEGPSSHQGSAEALTLSSTSSSSTAVVARRLMRLYASHPLYELRELLHCEATRQGYPCYQDPETNDIVATTAALQRRETLLLRCVALIRQQRRVGPPAAPCDATAASTAAAAHTEATMTTTPMNGYLCEWELQLQSLFGCHHSRERHCPHYIADRRRSPPQIVSLKGSSRDERRAGVMPPSRPRASANALTTSEEKRDLRDASLLSAAAGVPTAHQLVLQLFRSGWRQSHQKPRGGAEAVALSTDQVPGVTLIPQQGRPPRPPLASGARLHEGKKSSSQSQKECWTAAGVVAARDSEMEIQPRQKSVVPKPPMVSSLDCLCGLEVDDLMPECDEAAETRQPNDANFHISAAETFEPHRVSSTLSNSSVMGSGSSSTTGRSCTSSEVSLDVVDEEDAFVDHDDYDDDDGDDDADEDVEVDTAALSSLPVFGCDSAAPEALVRSSKPPFVIAAPVAASSSSLPDGAPLPRRCSEKDMDDGGEAVAPRDSVAEMSPLVSGYSATVPFGISELAPEKVAALLQQSYYVLAHEMNYLACQHQRTCYHDPITSCLVLTSLFLSQFPSCYGEYCRHCPHDGRCHEHSHPPFTAKTEATSSLPRRHSHRRRHRHPSSAWRRTPWAPGYTAPMWDECGSDSSSVADADHPEDAQLFATLDAGVRSAVDGGDTAARHRATSSALLQSSTPSSAYTVLSGAASSLSSLSDDDDDDVEEQHRHHLLRSTSLLQYVGTQSHNDAGVVVHVNSFRDLLRCGPVGVPPLASALKAAAREGDEGHYRHRSTADHCHSTDDDTDDETSLLLYEASFRKFDYLDYAAL